MISARLTYDGGHFLLQARDAEIRELRGLLERERGESGRLGELARGLQVCRDRG